MEQAEAVWEYYALLDASTLALVKDPGYAPRPGRDTGGLDAPPSRGLRGTDVQTAHHDNASSRVKLAAVSQRHRPFGKVRDWSGGSLGYERYDGREISPASILHRR
jgi:hypothetical protein